MSSGTEQAGKSRADCEAEIDAAFAENNNRLGLKLLRALVNQCPDDAELCYRLAVIEEQIDDRGAEFPRVPDSLVGLKHRYGYMMAMSEGDHGDPSTQSGAILKYDRDTGARSEIAFGKGRVGGEPVFVPAANGQNEDDGYLMTYVYDAGTDDSSLVIMDAATMDDEPVASIELPRIPSGFHGSWVPSSVAD